ncbi:hypothetical protein [Lactiplantibacillus plantarum]|uniref:hypothetical protein n=1 Tax=Lactiplantibacillus plantarum TaxID=1590 RepID=UPI00114664B7|nr:hypothetical protein [Lactiplantibacillus plantarum]MCZ2273252.1 hypothetical protein [Lactiplantibacillus plantarum]WRM28368.1 hypothetical protein UHT29_00970 [Lactiplantibacillus plantarum]
MAELVVGMSRLKNVIFVKGNVFNWRKVIKWCYAMGRNWLTSANIKKAARKQKSSVQTRQSLSKLYNVLVSVIRT